ncbi:MAG: hypothetical protein ACK5L7_00235 [Paludibacteraceae bacterium]
MKNDKLTIEELSVLKMQIKTRLDEQKIYVEQRAKHLIPSSSATSNLKLISSLSGMALFSSLLPFRAKKMRKGFSVANGLLIGYQTAKGIASFIRKRLKSKKSGRK